MNLEKIKSVDISRKRSKRIGRGQGSGNGKTAGKGMKGQNCRSGVTLPAVFEGGTMPLYRRMPKRGFNNFRFQNDWIIVNIDQLNIFKDGDEVSLKTLVKAGVLKISKSKKYRVKLLGNGELTTKKLKVKVHKVSEKAKEELEKAGANLNIIKIKRFKRARRKSS